MDMIGHMNKRIDSIFIMGDSISIHYTPYLKELARADGIKCIHYGENKQGSELESLEGQNCGSSARMLEISRSIDSSFHFDIVLFNCGLHDIKRDIISDQVQVSLSDYLANLSEIIMILRTLNVMQLIWVCSTPLDTEIHNSLQREFKRFSEDNVSYNQAAEQLMYGKQISVIDLYTFTLSCGFPECLMDHVHYKEEARKLQAGYIYTQLRKMTNKRN